MSVIEREKKRNIKRERERHIIENARKQYFGMLRFVTEKEKHAS